MQQLQIKITIISTIDNHPLQSTPTCELVSPKSFNWDSPSSHLSHWLRMLSGSGSSHPSWSLHSACKIILPFKTTGASRPRGSKMLQTVLKMPLRDIALCCTITRNLSWSLSTHQLTPKARSTLKGSRLRSMSLIPVLSYKQIFVISNHIETEVLHFHERVELLLLPKPLKPGRHLHRSRAVWK